MFPDVSDVHVGLCDFWRFMFQILRFKVSEMTCNLSTSIGIVLEYFLFTNLPKMLLFCQPNAEKVV